MESRHILVVDDDEAARTAIAELLEYRGYTVRQAANGRDGLRMASEQRPALILLDLSMPVLDGWSTLRELRCNPELQGVRVVVVSAESSPPSGVLVVEKPVSLDRILDAVQRPGEL